MLLPVSKGTTVSKNVVGILEIGESRWQKSTNIGVGVYKTTLLEKEPLLFCPLWSHQSQVTKTYIKCTQGKPL